MDHYYLPLDRQPKYQIRQMREDVDYDSIESMDVQLVNEHLAALIEGLILYFITGASLLL